MILLFIAVLLFGLVHLISAVPAWRSTAKATLATAYGPAYGIASLVLFALCIWAFRAAPTVLAYDNPSWGRHANYLLTWLAFLSLGIFLFRGSWRNTLRIPMTIAVVLWAIGHLLANNETKSLLLFGGMLAIALVQGWATYTDKTRQPGDERGGHNLMSLIFGTALYGIMAQMHGALIGVNVFELLK
jgi:uncharacterized membrane protein